MYITSPTNKTRGCSQPGARLVPPEIVPATNREVRYRPIVIHIAVQACPFRISRQDFMPIGSSCCYQEPCFEGRCIDIGPTLKTFPSYPLIPSCAHTSPHKPVTRSTREPPPSFAKQSVGRGGRGPALPEVGQVESLTHSEG
jgi:hypothetical protein